MADSGEKLYQLVKEIGQVCRRSNLRVNENKSKIMKCTRGNDSRMLYIALNGEMF